MARKKKEPEQIQEEVIDLDELVQAIDNRFNAIESVLAQQKEKEKKWGFEVLEYRDDLANTKGFHWFHPQATGFESGISKNYVKYCKYTGKNYLKRNDSDYLQW